MSLRHAVLGLLERRPSTGYELTRTFDRSLRASWQARHSQIYPELAKLESAGLVERVLHHMCHALSEGMNVKVSGFGTFILRDKGQRIGRNPKTGIEVPIAPRRVMTFRASQIMRDRIAKG